MAAIAAGASQISFPPPRPRHIAVIMDGNGRWARQRGLPRIEGHRRGADALRRCVRCCLNGGVEFLTAFGFSSDNWRRPDDEIAALMQLLRRSLQNDFDAWRRQGVVLSVIGDRSSLPGDIDALLKRCENANGAARRLTLTLALGYSGRQDIVAAARSIAQSCLAGELAPEALNERSFASFLSTAALPEPDLLIRSSGERRLSNFMLWQMAYTEFYFTDVYWPQFGEQHFNAALRSFAGRERRYGA